MAISNFARAIAILAGAFLILSDRMTLVLLILIVLINAGGRAMYYSPLQALVPELVSSDALESANGVLTGTEAGTEYLAGPVAGTLLFAVSKAIPFFTDAVVTALSCFPLFGFRSRAPRPEGSSTSALEGVRLLLSDRRLRVLLWMVVCLAGLQGMEAGVLVLMATTQWGVREGAYGIFLAVGAVGNLTGSLGANWLVRRFGSGKSLIGAALASGVAYLIMAAAHGWGLAGPAFALVGFAVGIGAVVSASLRQRLTPPDLMGRVGGAWRGLTWGAPPLGALLAGGLAAIGDLRLPLVIAGTLQCVIAVILARPLLHSLREGSGGTT
jgi:Na+/melibiose symporter-like transporter